MEQKRPIFSHHPCHIGKLSKYREVTRWNFSLLSLQGQVRVVFSFERVKSPSRWMAGVLSTQRGTCLINPVQLPSHMSRPL